MNRVVRLALPLIAPLALSACFKPPEIVMVDRATALEQQASGSFDDLERKLSDRTKVVAFALASNATGSVAEAKRICTLAREAGYAVAIDQLDYGVAAIAAPIRDPESRVVAAINSSGYTGALTRAAMVEQRLPQLRASAAALAQVLRRHRALLHSLRPVCPPEDRDAVAPASEAGVRNA